MRKLLRYIETPKGRSKVVHVLGTYVPLIGILVALLLLADRFL